MTESSVKVTTLNDILKVINPVTNSEFCVPPLANITKDVFRSAPNSMQKQDSDKKYYMFVIHELSGSLAYFRPGEDGNWTDLKATIPPVEADGYVDAIYYKRKLYALHQSGELLVCDINAPPLKKMKGMKFQVHPVAIQLGTVHLVESEGDLLLVDRDKSNCITMFQVYKLDPSRNKWNLVTSLGEQALFLGINQGFSLSGLNAWGIRGNSIYFLNDKKVRGSIRQKYDVGVFNLPGSSMKLFVSQLPLVKPSTIWFVPVPW